LSDSDMPLIAFVTAYDEHAIRAFELNAMDYLLKPVDKDRLRMTLERTADRLAKTKLRQAESDKLKSAINTYEELSRSQFIERIPVKKRDDILLVPVQSVASIVADGELLRITTVDNEKYVINFRLKDLESRLDPRLFVRLSRGALVNVNVIARVSPVPGGTFLVALENGQEIPTSRQQSKVLRSDFLKL
jgi:two-component system, LytTR family, response regulator